MSGWSRVLSVVARWMRHAGVGAVCLTGGLMMVSAPASAQSPVWAKRIWGYLRMSDGAQLRYSVLLPAATGRFPVLLNYNGYDAGTIGGTAYQQGDTWMETDLDARLLDAGYAIMGLQVRGTGCSTGNFDMFSPYWGTDGAAAVEWAAQQSWSSGHVGMYLWSWPGITQLAVAADRPPHLDAIAPGMVVADGLRDVVAPGGIPNLLFPPLWQSTIMASWALDAVNAVGDGDTTCLANLARNYVLEPLHFTTVDSTHPFEDSYWQARDLRSMTAKISVAVLSMADWQDEEAGPRGGYYQDLLDPATTWYVGTNGQHDIYVSDQFAQTLLAFFDHYLKGTDNGFELTPHVQLWMDTTAPGGPQSSDAQLEQAAPGFVVTQDELPLRALPLTLYLTRDGRLSTAAPGAGGGSKSYAPLPGPIVNNDIPGALTGQAGGTLGEETWQSWTPLPGAQLAFTTAPLRAPLTVAGSASLNLWLSSSAPDTDIQVTLTEVRPDGQEQYIQRGWLRASERAIDPGLSGPLRPVHRQTLASVEPLIAGVPALARVEIPMFAHTFRAGSALRIWLDAPSNTGDWGFASEPPGAVDTVWTNSAHPSALVLGQLPTGAVPASYPACGSLVGEPCRTSPLPVR